MAKPYPGRRWECPVRITLTCGCIVKARITPIGPNVHYGCTSGLGHGYCLPWVRWTDGITVLTNRAVDCARNAN
ncbi:hypothetical protein [Kitasatospora sp. NPDC047058]|uniref:hypothetical protein n=1 Tax=Kitasatospora sp. NPDC047058 TaxID=3155620 RepID=UPI0033C86D8F